MSRRSKTAVILLVEDDHGLRQLIREELTDDGYRVQEAANVEDATKLLERHPPDVIVSDLRLPGANGMELLDRSRQGAFRPAFIAITAFGTVEQAVAALKRGADNFLTKPLNLEHLRLSVARALEHRAMEAEINRYRQVLREGEFHGLIGKSRPMRLLFERVRLAAQASGPVLLMGESGVGKELVARALHAESPRREKPFLAVNCAGIPPELLESELFGHRAGAFTGAQRARKGLFGEADGGTILLDEIGEMPPAMQSKLLRVLEDGHVRPVGDDRERSVDVRVVAATNRNLEDEIEQGNFRADLFYRLETFTLEVPPLRERADDVDLLTANFIARFGLASGRSVRGISAAALARLRVYPFPGNVRELSNAMERAVAFARGEEIEVADLPERIRKHHASTASGVGEGAPDPLNEQEPLPLREVERRYVRHVLERMQGNKRRTAELLGIGRRTLYRYLEG
ncbi:sigma-54-dependent transcriptional regulator [Gilvimarinus sp. F26214L]|uniref:sigma-54-dependent transcriptional regulator n=1 Tax=Gilvimarinus sp. DZF01 TaxID=3461371 RepID=UPI0040464CAD